MGKARDELTALVMREWPVIKEAPTAFGACVLLAGIALGAGWYGAFQWRYSGTLESKNATIESLSSRVATLTGDVADLRERLGLPAVIPHEEDAIYQDNRIVGRVVGARVDQIAGIATMESITINSSFLVVQNVYFRNLELHMMSAKSIPKNSDMTFTAIKWEIAGRYPPNSR